MLDLLSFVGFFCCNLDVFKGVPSQESPSQRRIVTSHVGQEDWAFWWKHSTAPRGVTRFLAHRCHWSRHLQQRGLLPSGPSLCCTFWETLLLTIKSKKKTFVYTFYIDDIIYTHKPCVNGSGFCLSTIIEDHSSKGL